MGQFLKFATDIEREKRMKLLLAALFTVSSITLAQAGGTDQFFDNASGTPLLSLLANAKTSIDIEIYEMDDPLFIQTIDKAISKGVRVRVVKEERPVGASCRVFTAKANTDSASCAAQKVLVKTIDNAGGVYLPFKKDTLCGVSSACYEHGKIVLVDGKQALISTGNFNSSNLCNKNEHPNNCNRDYSVVSRDTSVVATLEQIFESDVRGVLYDVSALLMHSNNQKLTVSPFSLAPLVALIKSAKTKVQIQNQYLKDPDLNQAIVEVAKSGVQVEVMVASVCAFGKPRPNEIAKWQKTYGEFDQAGVKTRIFTRNIKVGGVAGYLHAKAIVIDGNRAWVGSVNGSTTSLADNREYGIFVNDLTETKKLKSFMDSDFANSMGESWQDSVQCKHDPAPAPQGTLPQSSDG